MDTKKLQQWALIHAELRAIWAIGVVILLDFIATLLGPSGAEHLELMLALVVGTALGIAELVRIIIWEQATKHCPTGEDG